MAKYSGKTFTVPRSAQEISDKFADLTELRTLADKLPEDQRAKLENVEFTTDSIQFPTPQLGKITFRVTERTPQQVLMNAEGTPVPLVLKVEMDENAPASTAVTCSVEVEIPAMLRAFVGPQLQKSVNMLSDVISKAVS